MRLLIVADGRSPIAVNWMRFLIEAGVEVHLASSYAHPSIPGLASQHYLPMALSGMKGSPESTRAKKKKSVLWSAALVGLRTRARQWLGPLTLSTAARQLKFLEQEIQPDLVHAMRIPYEGMTAGLSGLRIPLIVSVWGNDFTLHADTTPWMRRLTTKTLRAANALHTDCQRDQRLARAWGFSPRKPAVVLPSSGGVRRNVFYPEASGRDAPVIINPRGFRAYIRNDTFFAAVPLVLERYPQARFICPTMEGERQAERILMESGCEQNVELLPRQSPVEMADLYRRSQIAVSPSIHDGTPNTLLESMACGCFPVAGDIESLREWIVPGVNGLLVDPYNAVDLSAAILTALASPSLRQSAQAYNHRLVDERADQFHVMAAILNFYEQLAG